MRGAVWGATFQTAIKKLDSVIEDYIMCRINPKQITKTKNNYWVEFENGDIWRACAARESALGIRTNVAYIDHMISPIFVDEVIKPHLTAYPFQAFHYYWPEEDNNIEENFI